MHQIHEVGRERDMYHRSASSPPILEQQQPPVGMATAAFRRALSTGDLLEEPVRRYTAKERRERIERYRSKRKRRNFQKKITYACRKTLAESRRRIKGRFAHTGDVDGDQKGRTETVEVINDEQNDPHPSNVVEVGTVDGGKIKSNSDSSPVPEWWPAMEEALSREDLRLFDGEMLASYLGVDLY